jgi:hypothetical protein
MNQVCTSLLRLAFKYRWLVLAALLFAGPATVAAQTDPSPAEQVRVAEYWQQLTELKRLAERLHTEPVETQQTELVNAANELAQITSISLPSGQNLPINHSFLIQLMRAEPPDLPRLSSLLAALESAQNTWPDPQFTTYDPSFLAKILESPEFQYQTTEPSALEQWWQNLWQRFSEWLSRILPEQISTSGEFVNQIITFVGALALLAVLFYALRDMLRDFVRQAELPTEGEEGEENLTADSALRQAQRLSDSGDYRTAVRYLYLSALLILEERGLLRYDRSRTNREYLRSVQHQPKLAATLQDVVEVFDRVWYGYQRVDAEAFRHYTTRVETLKSLR